MKMKKKILSTALGLVS